MSEKVLIENKLKDIFIAACSPINIFKNDSSLDMELLGNILGLSSRHLLFIYFAIEREFQIKIPEYAITEGKFNTFNNILKCIYKEKGINE